jgi:hypothetical protein
VEVDGIARRTPAYRSVALFEPSQRQAGEDRVLQIGKIFWATKQEA